METGLKTVFPAGQTLLVNGQTMDMPTLCAEIEKVLVPFDQADATRLQWDKDLAVREAATPGAKLLAEGIAEYLGVLFNHDATKLAAYGVPPKKPRRKLTSAENLAKATKAKATRDMRG